jgi:hypothetical protein
LASHDAVSSVNTGVTPGAKGVKAQGVHYTKEQRNKTVSQNEESWYVENRWQPSCFLIVELIVGDLYEEKKPI